MNPKLYVSVFAVLQVVDSRPKCWRSMCASRQDLLPWLVSTCHVWEEPLLICALKLVRLALPSSGSHGQQATAAPDHPAEVSTTAAPQLPSSPLSSLMGISPTAPQDLSWLLHGLESHQPAMDQAQVPGSSGATLQPPAEPLPLASFVTAFLLRPGSTAVRSEAAGVLRAVWRACQARGQGRIMAAMLGWVPRLAPYGDLASHYFDLLTWMARGGTSSSSPSSSSTAAVEAAQERDLLSEASAGTSRPPRNGPADIALLLAAVRASLPGFPSALLETLREANAALADHPHAAVYEALQGLTEFEGYFLEGSLGLTDAGGLATAVLPPLLPSSATTAASGSTSGNFALTRLDSLRAETKYTANSISCRLNGRYAIKAFSLQVITSSRCCPLLPSVSFPFLAEFPLHSCLPSPPPPPLYGIRYTCPF